MKKTHTHNSKAPLNSRVFKHIETYKGCSEYELTSNGLRIIIAPLPQSKAVTTNIVYRVGSRHEARGETGIAHMLEHMIFKPTKHPKKTSWKDLENKGALLNANTWLDRTMYFFNMPAEFLGDMLEVEAERMRHVLLTAREFEPERTNVLSEYEMYNSRPEMALEWNVVAAAFQSHGYEHDTIGFRADIEAYTPKKLQSFYDRHYWPDNAVLVVAGDVTPKEVLPLVQAHFGGIQRTAVAVPNERISEPEQQGERRVTVVRDTPMRHLHMAFKAPRFQTREWIALHLALEHLTHGVTSALYQALVETHLATAISATVYPTHEPFLAFFYVTLAEKSTYVDIERTVRNHIDAVAKKPLTAARMRELKERTIAQEIFAHDGTMGIASSLAEHAAAGDWKHHFDIAPTIESITSREIKDVVAKYLTPQNMTLGIIERP